MVTVLRLRWGTRPTTRAPSASSIGGANPDRPVSTSPATAPLASLRCSIWALIGLEPLDGIGDPDGQLGEHGRDPVVVGAPFLGMAHRHGHEAADDVAVARLAAGEQQRRGSPAVTAASTTSLTVPPSVLRICLDVGQGGTGPVPPPMGADGPVERRPLQGPDDAAQAGRPRDEVADRPTDAAEGRHHAHTWPGRARRGW